MSRLLKQFWRRASNSNFLEIDLYFVDDGDGFVVVLLTLTFAAAIARSSFLLR